MKFLHVTYFDKLFSISYLNNEGYPCAINISKWLGQEIEDYLLYKVGEQKLLNEKATRDIILGEASEKETQRLKQKAFVDPQATERLKRSFS